MSLSSQQHLYATSRLNRIILGPGIGHAVSRFQRGMFEKAPQVADPLNLTDAQAIKAQKDYDREVAAKDVRARKLQADINKRYGLQGNLTILGG